jgi:hypothetical protein
MERYACIALVLYSTAQSSYPQGVGPQLDDRSMHRSRIISAACALLLAQLAAHANTYLYSFAGTATSTASGSSGQVNVATQFTLLSNEIDVSIWNYQTNVVGDLSTLNSIDFVLSGGETSGSITGRLGIERTINTGGTYTDTAFTTGWGLLFPSPHFANGLTLTAITGGTPHEIIIGPPNADGKYDTANNSILNHDPLLATPNQATPVKFVLSIPGVTTTTTITAITYDFGTDRTAFVDPGLVDLSPEPGSWCLIGTGLALLGIGWRRRRT